MEIDGCEGDNESGTIWTAFRGGDLDFIRLSIDSRIDLSVTDIDGNRPYLLAAQYGHLEALKLAFSVGADVLNAVNYHGDGSYLLAAIGGHMEILQWLLSLDHDLGRMNNERRTALHCASLHGHTSLVRWLLEHNSDINAIDSHGQSSLLIAAQHGHIEAVKALLERGATLPLTFPLSLASSSPSILKILFETSHSIESCSWIVTKPALDLAISSGSLRTLRWLFDSGNLSTTLLQNSMAECWIQGKLDILDFVEMECGVTSNFSDEELIAILQRCEHLSSLNRLASPTNSLSSRILALLRVSPSSWLKQAIGIANVPKLEWLLSLYNNMQVTPDLIHMDTIQSLLRIGGEVAQRMFDWLDAQGVRWQYDPSALQEAFLTSSSEGPCLIKRLFAPSRGCTFDDLQRMEYSPLSAAAFSGNLDTVKWILSLALPSKSIQDSNEKSIAIVPSDNNNNTQPFQTHPSPLKSSKFPEISTTSPDLGSSKSPIFIAAKNRHWAAYLYLDSTIQKQNEWRSVFRFDTLPPVKVFDALCKHHSEEELCSSILSLSLFNHALSGGEYSVASYCLDLLTRRGAAHLDWLRNSVWRGVVKDRALLWFVYTRKLNISALFETIDARRYGQSMWWGAAAHGDFEPLEWAQRHGYWPGRTMTAQIEADIAQARVTAALSGNREATLRLWRDLRESFSPSAISARATATSPSPSPPSSSTITATASEQSAKDIAEAFLVLLDRDAGRLQPSIVADLIHIIGVPVNYTDRHGRTSLHHAASSGHCAIIKCLLEAGAVMKSSNDGTTPIMIAARKENTDAMDVFIEAGATVTCSRSANKDARDSSPSSTSSSSSSNGPRPISGHHDASVNMRISRNISSSHMNVDDEAQERNLSSSEVAILDVSPSSPSSQHIAYSDEVLETLLERASFKVLEWVKRKGFPIPPNLMERAISLGHQPAQVLVDHFLQDGKQLPLETILSGLSRSGELLGWLLRSNLFTPDQVAQYSRVIASVAFHSNSEGVKILQVLRDLHVDIPSSLVAANLPAILSSHALFDWIREENSESMRPLQSQLKVRSQAMCVLKALVWKTSERLVWLRDTCGWDFYFLREANRLAVLESIEASTCLDNVKFLVPTVFDAHALDDAKDSFGENALVAAVRQQNVAVTKWLVQEIGCSPRVLSMDMSLVDIAASAGNLELTKFLLEEGRVPLDLAFPNDDESEDPSPTALEHACLNGTNPELMTYLFEKTEAFRYHLLHHCFVRLLQAGSERDPDGISPWLWFIEKKGFKTHKYYFRNQYTSLLAAMYSTRIEKIEKLFELGSRLSERTGFLFYDAVTIAAAQGWTEGLKWLIQHGCGTRNRDFYGWTPLHHAASADHLEAFQYLISVGCSPSALSTDGQSPLMIGLTNPIIGPWLIENGFVDPNNTPNNMYPNNPNINQQ